MEPLEQNVARLPDGYRIVEVDEFVGLFTPDGLPLATERAGPDAMVKFRKLAWQDTWRHLALEVSTDMAKFRAGYALDDLKRLRQYNRLLEAVRYGRMVQPVALVHPAAQPVAAREEAQDRQARVFHLHTPVAAPAAPPARAPLWTTLLTTRRMVPAFAALAAAAALILVLARPESPLSVDRETATRVPRPAVAPAPLPARKAPATAARPVAPPRAQEIAAKPPAPQPAGRTAATTVARRVLRRPVGYFTAFGRFPTRAAAEPVARLVRTKGYIAKVVPRNGACMVVGHTYHTRREAERMAQVFRDIGLPASVGVITAPVVSATGPPASF